jgi:branched-chain amino acid transport system ATP-binding protein
MTTSEHAAAPGEAQTETPILSLEGIEAVYDGIVVALRGVSLVVPEGSIVALLGANGAGKTTTLRAASGLLRAERGAITRGSVRYRGRDVSGAAAPALVRDGLVQVLEGRHCFPHLTVDENLRSGALLRRPGRRALRTALDEVYAMFPRLAKVRRKLAGFTSGGEQQMIAIGRALLTRPVLVLLDEPSMGLAPQIVEEIFHDIRT